MSNFLDYLWKKKKKDLLRTFVNNNLNINSVYNIYKHTLLVKSISIKVN